MSASESKTVEPTADELRATIEALTVERDEALAKARAGHGTVSMKVTEKGGASMYGLGRYPTTLYRSQWEALAGFVQSGKLDEFLKANNAKLTRKPGS